jgi:hypothetical protein
MKGWEEPGLQYDVDELSVLGKHCRRFESPSTMVMKLIYKEN